MIAAGERPRHFDFIDLVVFLTTGYLMGVITAIFGVGFVLLTASLYGTFARMKNKCHIMPAAMQAACLTSGVLVTWAMGMWLLGAIGVALIARSFTIYNPSPAWMSMLALTWLAYHLIFALIYFVLTGRVLAGAKYGNV